MQPSDRGYGLIDDEYIEYDNEKDYINSGAFAEVFRARLKKDGTGKVLDPPVEVAAKVVTKPSEPRLSPRDKDILCKEAAILTRLKPHRNVVGMLGFSPNPKHFILLLEYVNGGSLDEWLFPPDLQAGKRPVDISLWNHRIDIACQIAQGLVYLHTYEPSVAHMDMKCSNILLQHKNDELICKISDFGLSKVKGISTWSRRTQVQSSSSHVSRKASGTYQYMAPEQYDYKVDWSSEISRSLVDVYSFGLILWEIRERVLIFQDAPLEVIVMQKKQQAIPPNAEQCPGCPDEYQRLILCCCKKNPKERPRSSEVLRKLNDMKPRIIKSIQCTPSVGKELRNGSAETVQEPVDSVTSSLVKTSLSTFSKDVIRQHVERLKAEIGDAKAFENSAKLIHQIALAVLKDPEEDKYRRVNTVSKSFGLLVWRYVKARALLYHVGFDLKEDKRIYLEFGANLEGLKILRFIFEEFFSDLSATKTASASSAVSDSSRPLLSSAAVADEVVSASGLSRQRSHTKRVRPALDSLYSVGALGSLIAFINHQTYSRRSLREFPSVFAEVKALLFVLFDKGDSCAVLQECWSSLRSDSTNITDPQSLSKYHKQFKPFVDLVRQNVVKTFGKRSAEFQLFEYLDRITNARPVINQTAEQKELLGEFFPHYLDENYLKLPDCIPKERFSEAFHQRAKSISRLYIIFLFGDSDLLIVEQLKADLSWIEVFFTSHFFSNFQLKMKEEGVFEDNDVRERLESTLKLADILQRFPSAAFSGSILFSAEEFNEETVMLLSKLEIASCDSEDDVIPRLHRFTDGWSHKNLQKDDKIRDFWNLELEIGIRIFEKWGQECANMYFFAITAFMLAEGFDAGSRVREVDRMLVDLRGFSHRNVLHFFLPKAADQLMSLKITESEELLWRPKERDEVVMKTQSCLLFIRTNLLTCLKPSKQHLT